MSTSELFLPKKKYQREHLKRKSDKSLFVALRSKIPFLPKPKASVVSNSTPTGNPIPKDFTPNRKQAVEYKIFRPKTDVNLSETQPSKQTFSQFSRLRSTISRPTLKLPFALSFELPSFRRIKKRLKYISFTLRREVIFDTFNRIMAAIVICVCLTFLVYIAFFDQFFLVKSYTIQFAQNSFLSTEEVKLLSSQIRDEKMLGIIPANQYWFLNNYNLTSIAKKAVPDVSSVEIVERKWPDTAVLNIKTEPILITLGVIENGQKRYWRLNQNAEVIAEDLLNLREKLVIVDLEIHFDRQGGSLKHYSFSANEEQKNRFWFTTWLWSELGKQGISINKTSFQSILDSDVEVQTVNGTKLLFNSENINSENQKKRISAIFTNTTVKQDEQQGKYNYIDFRIPKKVFLCEKGSECAK